MACAGKGAVGTRLGSIPNFPSKKHFYEYEGLLKGLYLGKLVSSHTRKKGSYHES